MAKKTRFVDEANIKVESGKGGDGCISFRREKYVPKGGPDGGDGGQGGNVYLLGDPNKLTLLDFKYRRHFKAGKGLNGKGKAQNGKNGKDCLIPVPLGVSAIDKKTGEIIGEVRNPGERVLLAKGGKGGRGNKAFVSSTNRAPRKRELGQPGETKKIQLILKIIAEIGLVGLPNAGKSTLLKALSGARPEIAPYPFTTLTPNLGVMQTPSGDYRFTLCDIPGIVEGAHRGKGLGHLFLKHIERCHILVYVLDITRENPQNDYIQIRRELKMFKEELLYKPGIIVVNKIDLEDNWRDKMNGFSKPFYSISALTLRGVKEFKRVLIDKEVLYVKTLTKEKN